MATRIEKLLNIEPEPWYVDAYWAIYRFFKYHVRSPFRWCREIKWKFQRMNRGWAECDTWNLDSYLSKLIPEAITHLKNEAHGYPSSFAGESPEDHINDDWKPRVEKWNHILDEICDGFHAHTRIVDSDYQKEIGEFPLRTREMSDEEFNKAVDKYFRARQKEIDKDQKIFKHGMKLFTIYFGNLWD